MENKKEIEDKVVSTDILEDMNNSELMITILDMYHEAIEEIMDMKGSRMYAMSGMFFNSAVKILANSLGIGDILPLYRKYLEQKEKE